jgi:outer membrane protein assembly factor BamB
VKSFLLSSAIAALAVASAFSVTGCGGNELHPKLFSSDWSDDGGASIAGVRNKLRDVQFTRGADVVLAIPTSAKNKIIGMPMSGGAKWTVTHALDARPQIAGSIVVGSGGGEVFALDATTGKQLWSRATGGLPVRGAGDDGNLTAVTLGKVDSAGSVLLVIARDGSVKRQVETDKVLGVPAMLGAHVFVPWSNQYVSAYDAVTGEEVGRVTLREKVSRAWTESSALYFGEVGIFRFDDHIKDASKNGASHIGIPQRELPGTPRLLVPGTERIPVVANALDQARLYARPAGGAVGAYGVDTNRFFATYYSLIMSFDSQSGKLAWVHTNKADVIGGEAVPGGLVTCDEDGKVITFDSKSGGVLAEASFGEPIQSCVVFLDSYKPQGSAPAKGTLSEQISTAVTNREATLATAQRLLLRELATLPDESATKTLVDLARDPRTPPVVEKDARTALAQRRTGAQYMLSALAKHYDFLGDVLVSPPVGPMAEALAAMKEPKASSTLAPYLTDPNITDDDVKRVAAAMLVSATPQELPQLRTFFMMYRAGSESEDMAIATATVAQTILKLDPKDGRTLLTDAAKDPFTTVSVKNKLEAILAAEPAPAAPAAAASASVPAPAVPPKPVPNPKK